MNLVTVTDKPSTVAVRQALDIAGDIAEILTEVVERNGWYMAESKTRALSRNVIAERQDATHIALIKAGVRIALLDMVSDG